MKSMMNATLYDVEELALSSRGRGFYINKYVYVRDKERQGKIYVRCQERKICQARAVIFPDLKKGRLMHTPHTHEPPVVTQVSNKMRLLNPPRKRGPVKGTIRMFRNGAPLNTGRKQTKSRAVEKAFASRVIPMSVSNAYLPPDVQLEEQQLLESFRQNAYTASTSRDSDVTVSLPVPEDENDPIEEENYGGGFEQEFAGPSTSTDEGESFYVVNVDEDGFIPEVEEAGPEDLESSKHHVVIKSQTEDSEEKELRVPDERKRPGGCREFQRTRSINAPIPAPSFGPKACLKKVPPSQMMQVTDPSSQKLIWRESPLTVLVIKKIMDISVLEPFKELAKYLLEEKKLIIYVESKVLEEPELMEDKEFDQYRLKMKTFRDGDQLGDKIDFIVCLGGDGTLLYASSLFQEGTVPPVIAFHLGSFGFLTPYEFSEFREAINVLLEGNTPVTLRSRLKCLLFEDDNIPSDLDRENVMAIRPVKIPDPPNLKFKWECLNEVVIDRGSSPYLSNLDLYLDDRHITTVQGDGLIISTPTGSTAYAAAAGASMIHPNVPAILITPICPHTLSFRPIVVPAGVELKVTVSPDARHTAWVSLDGKHRQEIHKGWCLRITNSVFPVASVCSVDQIVDWFDSLMACMHWNEREQQKSFKPRERLRKSLPANGSSEKQSKTNGGK